jgi:hypothetical protein
MRSFNAAPPAGEHLRLTETIELGWEHTVEADRLVYTVDSAGAHVPKRHTVPATLTASDLMRASRAMPAQVSERLGRGEFDLEVAVELVGSVLGRDVVTAIADDPTVTTDALLGFVMWCLQLWGVAGAAPGEAGEPDPFVQGSAG